MTRRKSDQVVLSIFWIGLAIVVNYVITFFLTQYVTENLSAEAYGFVSLAKTFANYATIITVALNSFSSRFIAVEYHKGNIKKANTYFNSVIIADVILGISILAITILPIANIEFFLDVPRDILNDVKLLFLLDLLNFALVSSGTAFEAANVTKNRLDLTGIFKCISYTSEGLTLAILFLFFTPKVYFVGIGLIVASLFLIIQNFCATKIMLPELHFKKTEFSLEAVKNLVVNGIWNSVNSVGNLLNSGLDLLVSNTMLSALQMGQLAIVKTVYTIFNTLYSTVFQPFQPLLLKAYAEDNKEKLIRIFKISIKICGIFSNVLFAGFAVYGAVYFNLWVPSQDADLLFGIAMITLCGGIIDSVAHPLFYTYTLTLKNKIPCFVTLFSGLMNVAGMYVGIRFFNGGIGVVVGTTAVLSWINNFVFTPLYVSRCLNIKRTTFYPTLLRHIMSCVVLTIVFKLISEVIYPSTWIGLIVTAVFCAAVGAVIHILIVFDRSDFGLLKESLKRR